MDPLQYQENCSTKKLYDAGFYMSLSQAENTEAQKTLNAKYLGGGYKGQRI